MRTQDVAVESAKAIVRQIPVIKDPSTLQSKPLEFPMTPMTTFEKIRFLAGDVN